MPCQQQSLFSCQTNNHLKLQTNSIHPKRKEINVIRLITKTVLQDTSGFNKQNLKHVSLLKTKHRHNQLIIQRKKFIKYLVL